jgi:hypothetical protein
VLANAVYLKAPWANPFPENATADAPFNPRAGQSVTVPMMRGNATRDYVRGDGYQAVLLPYRASRLAMAIVLPDGALSGLTTNGLTTNGLATSGLTTNGLAMGTLGDLLAGTSPHRVTLSLPRFRVETDIDLHPVLHELGITAAFTGEADFSGITSAERLRIGAAVHKAYIDVDEHGTEAAAATAITFAASAMRLKQPPPVEMVADRPFLFAIIDAATGAQLFLGQVTNPVTNPRHEPSQEPQITNPKPLALVERDDQLGDQLTLPGQHHGAGGTAGPGEADRVGPADRADVQDAHRLVRRLGHIPAHDLVPSAERPGGHVGEPHHGVGGEPVSEPGPLAGFDGDVERGDMLGDLLSRVRHIPIVGRVGDGTPAFKIVDNFVGHF